MHGMFFRADVSNESPSTASDHFEELRLKIEAQKARIQKAENPFLKVCLCMHGVRCG